MAMAMSTTISGSCSSTLSPVLSFPLSNRTPVNPPPLITNLSLNSTKTPNLNQSSFQASFPDEAYAPLLELCASKKALSKGQQLHAHMIKSFALHDSVFLETKLVFMYGYCGSLLNAEKVFERMPERTIFTWNAMIGAYVSNGKPIKALELYRDMRLLAVPFDSCTFPCVLKACGMLKDSFSGTEIHSLAIKFGYVSINFVLNSLVSMYAKCNDLSAARRVFTGSDEYNNDVVSWNSIISAYSVSKKSIEALALFREMQKISHAMNTYTLVAALQACEDSLFKNLGKEIHAFVLKSNHYLDDIYVANALVAMYVRCGKMNEAASIFSRLNEKDNISWNTLLSGFVQNGLYNEALVFFHAMLDSDEKPDQVSILNIIAVFGRLGNLKIGIEVHAYAIKNGLDSDLQVGNTIMDMYAKCSRPELMSHVFDKLRIKDIISWTTIIAGYSQNNHPFKALEYFKRVQIEGIEVDAMMIGSILSSFSGLKYISLVKEIHGYVLRRDLSDHVIRNLIIDVYGECGNVDYAKRVFGSIETKCVVSWTSMISCYIHNGLPNEALELFYNMNESKVEPDYITLVSILSASASLSSLKKGREIHGFLIRKGFFTEGSIASSLVDMYSRCGTIENAYKVFNGITNKNLVLWTTMINANGMHGYGKEAIDLFNKMENEKLISPDHITFLTLLFACSHSGLIVEGKRFLVTMESKYHIKPWPEHYACVVDLLARANCLEEAYRFIKSMPIRPSSEVWCALLGGSQIHSNKELAEIAVEKLMEFDINNPGNYVLVSNTFASLRRWKQVEEVRVRMKGQGLKKNPGCSWIEIGNRVHTFMARDKAHPRSDEIYQKLDMIKAKLEKEGGYVPKTDYVLHNIDDEEKVQVLYGHSERLAIAYGLLETSENTPIRITKNLRICGDCHTFCKLVSRFFERELIVRDANRFHHFKGGVCSCGDFW